ncbi:MAG: M56 family metallopeptidase, partial [Planctomycetales bacterium]|nr:M56 family metallopeptidase [Planctomycetales bacterium]
MSGHAALALDSWSALLLIRWTLMLTAAWALQWGIRHANPRWRILLWRATTTGMLLNAAASLTLPQFTLRVLPASYVRDEMPAGASNASNGRFDRSPMLDLLSASTMRESDSVHLPAAQERIAPTKAVASTAAAEGRDVPNAANPTTREGQRASKSPTLRDSSLPLRRWLAIAWACGTLLVGARWMAGVRAMRQILADARPVAPEVERLAQGAARACGLNRVPQLRATAWEAAPCTFGTQRPVVLLPARLINSGDEHDLRGAIMHEFAHVTGRDLQWNAALQSVEALLWFHPLAWRMRLAHVDACDERCDAMSTSSGVDAGAYGRLLARLALETTSVAPSGTLTMARPPHVLRRIALLSTRRGAIRLSTRRVAAALLLCTTVAVALGAVDLGGRGDAAQPTRPADAGHPEQAAPADGLPDLNKIAQAAGQR